MIANLSCCSCGKTVTKIAEVVALSHGDAVEGAGTVEVRCTVGSRFSGLVLRGVICDDCITALSRQQGTMTFVRGDGKPEEIVAVGEEA